MSDIQKYPVTSTANLFLNRFESKGKKVILKEVVFARTKYDDVYNLSLADVNPETDEPDFEVKSKNGDLPQVFATVAWIIDLFTEKYPTHSVHIRGNEEYKTKAYIKALDMFLEELSSNDFEIFGIIGDIESDEAPYMEEYDKNKRYDAFLVKRHRKELKLHKN